MLLIIESVKSKRFNVNSLDELIKNINELDMPGLIYFNYENYNAVLAGFIVPSDKQNYIIVISDKLKEALNVNEKLIKQIKYPDKFLNYINSKNFIKRVTNKLLNRFLFSVYINKIYNFENIPDIETLKNELEARQNFNKLTKNIKKFRSESLYYYKEKTNNEVVNEFGIIEYKDFVNDVHKHLLSLSKNVLATNIYKIVNNTDLKGIIIKEYDKLSVVICGNDAVVKRLENDNNLYGKYIYEYKDIYRSEVIYNFLNLKYITNLTLLDNNFNYINKFIVNYNLLKFEFLEKIINMNITEKVFKFIHLF